MYPNLTGPLLVIVAVSVVTLAVTVLRQPVIRRLAVRQVARRRTEAALVALGSVLGTAIIVGALVVGDTLGHSVRQEAYRTLGPIDERIVTSSPAGGRHVTDELTRRLAGNDDVDGVVSARIARAAASSTSSDGPRAEPAVLAWDLDYTAASSFGGRGASGLDIADPPPGQVVVNAPLADSLDLGRGGTLTVYLGGTPHEFVVASVIAERGLAGAGLASSLNRNVFLPQGTLDHLALDNADQAWVTFVSNRGGVESGELLTDAVVADVRTALGSLATTVAIEEPKRDVLHAAEVTGAMLGALFLMIGSFSIIAGALLLVNIFVMLGEERKGQLGMLRAIGLKRSRLVESFTLEGALYAAVATLAGVVVGVGVGYGVSAIAARIFSSWNTDGSGIDVAFDVTATSLVNGAALGLLISLGTVLLTSVRISRFNIIAAIRDLPSSGSVRHQRLVRRASVALTAVFSALSVPALISSQAEMTFLLPSIAMLCATPLLRGVMSARRAYSTVATAILLWNLAAIAVRPDVFDSPSMAVYVIQGTLAAFAAVLLLSENQQLVLRPLQWLTRRSSELGLAVRLAIAYPLAKRFRTGATLVMYTLIVLVLVLLTTITGIFGTSMDRAIADATAGYDVRLDFNPGQSTGLLRDLRSDAKALRVDTVVPLVTARAAAADPGRRTNDALDAQVIGVPASAVSGLAFEYRLPSTRTDAEVWALVASDPRYVVIDQFFGHNGGPVGSYYDPGDTFDVTNPVTGTVVTKTIAGIARNATMFYPPGSATTASFPLIESVDAVRGQFRNQVTTSSALLRLDSSAQATQVASLLQGRYLSSSVVATPIEDRLRRMFAANSSFFQLMRGFLALGLLVGITGLGVVMVRAVRERRRTIGVLRALGFRARTIERSFLIESGLIAIEGVVLGVVLGLVTTWLMYEKSTAFSGLEGSFPIMWRSIGLTAAATLVASFLATLGPARRAARISPAIAVRVAE